MTEIRSEFWTTPTPTHVRERYHINMPKINTYVRQIEQCRAAYSRLDLNRAKSLPPTPFSWMSPTRRSKSLYFSLRSATVGKWFQSDIIDTRSYEKFEDIQDVASHVSTSDLDSMDQDLNQKKRFDPVQLSTYLKEKGYGSPALCTYSHNPRQGKSLPVGVKPRVLPKDPATREKIRGRARLDYEMANLRAAAFCEQHTQRIFRTASANMRNQDAQFLEDELREQWQVETNDKGDNVITSGYVAPIDRDELLIRINTWIDDVDKAMADNTVTR